MRVTARPATVADLDTLVAMYRLLEAEMADLHPMWPRADGLAEPVAQALASAIDDADVLVMVGEVDDVPLGFLVAFVAASLPQADGEPVGVIKMVFTTLEAREVGVAEAMRDQAMKDLRERGISKFDAHVLPGHRLAKNFFEAGGFSARSIIMHHDDNPAPRPGRDPRAYL